MCVLQRIAQQLSELVGGRVAYKWFGYTFAALSTCTA